MAGCNSSEVNINDKLKMMNIMRDQIENQKKLVQSGHRLGNGDGHHVHGMCGNGHVLNGHVLGNGHVIGSGHLGSGNGHVNVHGNGHVLNGHVQGNGHGTSCNGSADPVQRIIKGFNNFLTNDYRRNPAKFEQLALTQHPKFLVFSCSDSRVSPSRIIDFQAGEAFGARNISSLIPTFDKMRISDVGATIEYAVEELKVENILVIGHSKCGGITRLMKHPEDNSIPFDFIDKWVNIALPAKLKVKAKYGHLSFEEQRDLCVQEAVNISLANLQSYPYVQKAVAKGKLALRGAYYDFVAGSLKLWELKASKITPSITIK